MCEYQQITESCVACNEILDIKFKLMKVCSDMKLKLKKAFPAVEICDNASVDYESKVCVQCGCMDLRGTKRKRPDDDYGDDE